MLQAESEGFEPPNAFASPDFESGRSFSKRNISLEALAFDLAVDHDPTTCAAACCNTPLPVQPRVLSAAEISAEAELAEDCARLLEASNGHQLRALLVCLPRPQLERVFALLEALKGSRTAREALCAVAEVSR